jgi:hypothetical protein
VIETYECFAFSAAPCFPPDPRIQGPRVVPVGLFSRATHVRRPRPVRPSKTAFLNGRPGRRCERPRLPRLGRRYSLPRRSAVAGRRFNPAPAMDCGLASGVPRAGGQHQGYGRGCQSGGSAGRGSGHTCVQDGIHSVSTGAMPGMEAVGPLQIRCRGPKSPVFKPTLTGRPD